MKRIVWKLTALILTLCLLLTGCSSVFGQFWQTLQQTLLGRQYTAFEDMEYTRPDPDAFDRQLQLCLEAAETQTDLDALIQQVYALYELYYDYSTNYSLSNIYYYLDMSDSYWLKEYTYCSENSAQISAGMDKLFYALAESPLKDQLEDEEYFGDGFFDDYTGQSLWDEQFTQLMEQQTRLENEYDALCAQAMEEDYRSDEFYQGTGAQMAELFVELVALRGRIARYAGYDNFLEFAYDFYYDRDYTPAQALGYLEDVREYLVELYLDIPADSWDAYYDSYSEKQTFAFVKSCAEKMGGITADAFALMEEGGYYHIAYGKNKYNTSFEVFLPDYYVPFVFVSPTGTGRDPLTFAHEFGHFCNDYASAGRACGIDVAEIFSQGMEYLCLFYGEDTQALKKMKMADSLAVFVEQSAYASFEHQVYLLEEEELSVERIHELHLQMGEDFGFTHYVWDSRSYVLINHFFIAPAYVVSYVFSNDAAMQIYQAESSSKGAGLQLLENNLATQEATFLAFVKAAGFSDPFAEGRVRQLRDTFREILR